MSVSCLSEGSLSPLSWAKSDCPQRPPKTLTALHLLDLDTDLGVQEFPECQFKTEELGKSIAISHRVEHFSQATLNPGGLQLKWLPRCSKRRQRRAQRELHPQALDSQRPRCPRDNSLAPKESSIEVATTSRVHRPEPQFPISRARSQSPDCRDPRARLAGTVIQRGSEVGPPGLGARV